MLHFTPGQFCDGDDYEDALRTLGFDTGEQVDEALVVPDAADRLRANADHARTLGVTGVPQMVIGDQAMFAGQQQEPEIGDAVENL